MRRVGALSPKKKVFVIKSLVKFCYFINTNKFKYKVGEHSVGTIWQLRKVVLFYSYIAIMQEKGPTGLNRTQSRTFQKGSEEGTSPYFYLETRFCFSLQNN
jgi:hypothetical protein